MKSAIYNAHFQIQMELVLRDRTRLYERVHWSIEFAVGVRKFADDGVDFFRLRKAGRASLLQAIWDVRKVGYLAIDFWEVRDTRRSAPEGFSPSTAASNGFDPGSMIESESSLVLSQRYF